MRVLSYNLEKHKAFSELEGLFGRSGADVACLQEVTAEKLPGIIGGLSLITSTSSNRLGLAIYAKSTLTPLTTISKSFKKSIHDKIAKPAEERLLAVELENEMGDTSVLANLHASPLTSLNGRRREQILEGLQSLEQLGPASPLLMTGDFNYPIFQKHLELVLASHGYELSFADGPTYRRGGVTGSFDFVASKNFNVQVEVLEQGDSDHLPIVAEVSRTEAPSVRLQ